jgi:hypothetical protein
MALWPTFNLTATLKDGFQKTGLFPFSPGIIESTVKPVSKSSVVSPSTYSPQKKQLRNALADMNLSVSDINAVVSDAERKARGVSVAYDLADTLRSTLLQHNPPKQKRTKDVRLNTDAGLLLTESSVVLALGEKKAVTAEKKKRSAEKLANRRALEPVCQAASRSELIVPRTRTGMSRMKSSE